MYSDKGRLYQKMGAPQMKATDSSLNAIASNTKSWLGATTVKVAHGVTTKVMTIYLNLTV